MSNARSPVADPTASTEIKILNGTSLAVTRMPQRNADGISVNIQDAKSPKASQEKTIIRDTSDSMISLTRLLNNFQVNFPRGTDFWTPPTRTKITKIQEELSLSKREIRGIN